MDPREVDTAGTMTPRELLEKLRSMHFEEFIKPSGKLGLHGPAGALTDELRYAIDAMREEMASIVRDEADYPVATVGANLPPDRCSAEQLGAALERQGLRALTDPTTLAETLKGEGELYLHRGDLRAGGKVIGHGAAMVIEGNLVADDVLPLSDDVRDINWFIITGNLECRRLAVPEGVQLIVGGDVRARELASIATQDSLGWVGGSLSAPVVLSGLSAGTFTVARLGEVGRVFGHVSSFAGEVLEAPKGDDAPAVFDKRAVDERGRPHGDVVAALVACGIDPVPGRDLVGPDPHG